MKPREVPIKRRMDTWKLLVVGGTIIIIAGIAGVVAIGLTLPGTENPRATFLVEVAKILAAGVVVGFLGGGAKRLWDHAAERKRQFEDQLTTQKALFKSLHTATRKALRSLRDPGYSRGDSLDTLLHEDGDFEELLDQWEILEPAVAIKVKSSYKVLEEDFKNPHLTPELRSRAKKELLEWSKEISPRAFRTASGQPLSSSVR